MYILQYHIIGKMKFSILIFTWPLSCRCMSVSLACLGVAVLQLQHTQWMLLLTMIEPFNLWSWSNFLKCCVTFSWISSITAPNTPGSSRVVWLTPMFTYLFFSYRLVSWFIVKSRFDCASVWNVLVSVGIRLYAEIQVTGSRSEIC